MAPPTHQQIVANKSVNTVLLKIASRENRTDMPITMMYVSWISIESIVI